MLLFYKLINPYKSFPTSMNVLKLSPIIVSALMLAAHFFRIEKDAIVVMCICFPFLLVFKTKWAARSVQIILFLGGLEWLHIMYKDVVERMNQGEPWHRLAVVLCTVAAFTAASALVFRFKSLRKLYGFDGNREELDAA